MEIKQVINKALVVTAVNEPFKLEVYYISTHKWEIVVTYSLTETVREGVIDAIHEPIFGIDQSDWINITAHAETICEEILEENNDKDTNSQ